MSPTEVLGVLATLSVFVNRIIEAIKPILTRAGESLHLDDEGQAWLLRLVSIAVGVSFTVWMQLNFLSFLSSIPAYAGIVITGVVLGSGAGVVHQVTDWWTDFSTAFPTATISTTTTSGASGTTTSTTAKVEGPATVTSSGSNSG